MPEVGESGRAPVRHAAPDGGLGLLFAAALAKCAAGLAVAFAVSAAAASPPDSPPLAYHAGLVFVFGLSGLLLHAGGSRDSRSRLLGVAFALFGSIFAGRILARAVPGVSPGPAAVLAAAAALYLDALEPFVLWEFAWRFPRIQAVVVPAWFPPLARRLTLSAGLVLLAANLVFHFAAARGSEIGSLGSWFSPEADNGLFAVAIALLMLPSLALLVIKLRAANAGERRRLAWVVFGILAGASPIVLQVLVELFVPAYADFCNVPRHARAFSIVLTAMAMAAPAATAYAVVVDRVLDVRFVVRRAVRYALARFTVLGATTGLLLLLAAIAWRNRARPVAELLGGSPAAVVALVACVVLLVSRRALLDWIDRLFFREQYDARHVLVELVERSGRAKSVRDMALIANGVDRALHLEHVALLVHDERTRRLRDPEGRVRDLDANGALHALLAGAHTPLDVDLSSDGSALARLPQPEREWIGDAGARLIVPLFEARGALLGVLVLGDKRSELPFTHEDRMLLMAIAAAAARSLERALLEESPGPTARTAAHIDHAGGQCTSCGRVQDQPEATCHACGGRLEEAPLPPVLAGKFEIERQVGAGGMGVVYRARDLELERTVAIKTLPRVAPRSAALLRREARAMARLQHANLAVIHSMESWRGVPVLVMEYLAGGTLADRIREGPLPVRDVVEAGSMIGGVLHRVHRAGLLHRDIKPSNIGYTGEGVVKLLDFGLVELVANLSSRSTMSADLGDATPRAPRPDVGPAPDPRHSTGEAARVAGTFAYLSPEAMAMGTPAHGFDLWALAVTLFEALAGRNPFIAPTLTETRRRIAGAVVPDLREQRPECSPALAGFFASALALDSSRRPHSAADFVTRLRAASAAER